MHFSHHADGVEVNALDSPFRLPVPDACAYSITLQWRHDQWDDVSNHRRLDCLLNRWFRRRSKKTSKLRDTGLCEGNPPVTGGFPSQRASNAVNVSIWWGHHGICSSGCVFFFSIWHTWALARCELCVTFLPWPISSWGIPDSSKCCHPVMPTVRDGGFSHAFHRWPLLQENFVYLTLEFYYDWILSKENLCQWG